MLPGDPPATAGLPLSKAPNPEMFIFFAEEGCGGAVTPPIQVSLLVHVFFVSVFHPSLPVYLDKHRICSLPTWFVFMVTPNVCINVWPGWSEPLIDGISRRFYRDFILSCTSLIAY